MLVRLGSKSFKLGFSIMWTKNFQIFNLGLEEEKRDQIANIHRIQWKAREFQKKIYLCFIDYAKVFDCVGHNELWKTLKEMGITGHLIFSWKTCIQVKKQQLEPWMKQLTGSGVRKNDKGVYCHPVYNSYVKHSGKTPGWMSYKLESKLTGKISTTSNMWMIPL